MLHKIYSLTFIYFNYLQFTIYTINHLFIIIYQYFLPYVLCEKINL